MEDMQKEQGVQKVQDTQKKYQLVITPEVRTYLAGKNQNYLTVGLMKGGYC